MTRFAAAVLFLLSCAAAHAQFQRYGYRLLEAPPQFSDIFPQGLNNRGEVAGTAFPLDPYTGRRQAAWWDQTGRIHILPMADTDVDAYAADIADDGTVVGQTVRRPFEYGRPTVWRNGQQQFLPESPGEGGIIDINAAGTAFVGTTRRSRDGLFIGSYWSNGQVQRLDGLPGYYSPIWAINNVGQYVGMANFQRGDHPVTYFGSGGRFELFEPPGLKVVRLWDINDHGLMAGAVLDGGRLRGLVSDGKQHRLLEPLERDTSTFPKYINNDGVVIGESYADAWYHVVVYPPGESRPRHLAGLVNADSANFTYAIALNEAGQILTAGAVNGVFGHYVLTPEPAARGVPEPTAGVMLTAIGLCLGGQAARRCR